MSLSSAESRYIARRYARALFSLALEQKQEDKIASELESVRALFAGNDKLFRAVCSPVVGRTEKAAIVEELSKKAKISELLRNLLYRMALNNRLSCLEHVVEIYLELVANSKGIVNVEVITAGRATKKALSELEKAIESAIGSKVLVKYTENKNIIGGVMVKVGSKLLDYSVKGKLARLEASLKEHIVSG